MKRIVILTAFLAFLVGCATAETSKVSENYKGVIAERPILTPGDYWIYIREDGGEIEWKFIKQEGEQLVFEGGRPRDKRKKNILYTDLDLVPIKRIHYKTGEVSKEEMASERCLNFPLWLGKKWRFSYEVISRNLNIPVTIDVQCRVVSYKEIKVPAGVFEVFEIRRYGQTRGYTKDSSQETFWYAPKVKRFIKYESEKSPAELLEYNVQ